ncbi:hypothetical protein [Bradyrhizobium sp. CCBAU 53421]|uniref:hypothetical protein n=1 Tax=Bradyrhizobium sp. CCBAU 53421 TaxID=1325120 RepID=UPI00188D6A32|nr:hypothetical protein [Bradyrhizobium sp. CCBAU 53421]QOZ33209.1 hypothetical protein XH92_17285 [Bradyrhizobium sp. CCBAU 53421]
MEALGATRIVVLTPCFGGQVTSLYAGSVFKLHLACQARGIEFRWKMVGGDALITRARAEMIRTFLDIPEATHALFIDADIGFEPEQAFRLLDLNVDVAAAAYPAKVLDFQKLHRAVASNRSKLESASLEYVVAWHDRGAVSSQRKGFARVRFAGTGFLLLRRAMIEKMCTAYPQLQYKVTHNLRPDGHDVEKANRFALFDPIIEKDTGEYLSEDFAFCKRWTDIGGEIWMDMSSRLDHLGQFKFQGDLSTQFA